MHQITSPDSIRQHRSPPMAVRVGNNRSRDIWLSAMPAIFFVAAIVLAILMLQIDRLASTGALHVPARLLGGSETSVSDVLSVIAGASISVISLVFSSALVVLTLAASQFGSYLLYDFIRLRISRLTLSMYVATFVYTVLILTKVGIGPTEQFVPTLSAKVAVLLAFVSVALLIAFVFAISLSIQAQQVAYRVATDLKAAIAERQHSIASDLGMGTPDQPLPADLTTITAGLEEHGVVLTATHSGYLQCIDYHRLVRAAERADGVVRLAYRSGEFVVAGSTLATIWSPAPNQRDQPNADARDALTRDELARDVGRAHIIGARRTFEQDLEFAIDKLVQIALLALSTAVNNTFNAIICIDWLSEALRELAANPCEWLLYRDESDKSDPQGAIRVITQPLAFAALVDAAFGKIRYAANGNPMVVIHLLQSLARLAPSLSTTAQRAALAAHADQAALASLHVLTLEADRQAVEACYQMTCMALGHVALCLEEHRADA
jgi:uncharacterized membrane protein